MFHQIFNIVIIGLVNDGSEVNPLRQQSRNVEI